jgi:hypothetical protein
MQLTEQCRIIHVARSHQRQAAHVSLYQRQTRVVYKVRRKTTVLGCNSTGCTRAIQYNIARALPKSADAERAMTPGCTAWMQTASAAAAAPAGAHLIVAV